MACCGQQPSGDCGPAVLEKADRGCDTRYLTFNPTGSILLLMIEILHHLKDPKLWELWYSPYYGVKCRIYIINRSWASYPGSSRAQTPQKGPPPLDRLGFFEGRRTLHAIFGQGSFRIVVAHSDLLFKKGGSYSVNGHCMLLSAL